MISSEMSCTRHHRGASNSMSSTCARRCSRMKKMLRKHGWRKRREMKCQRYPWVYLWLKYGTWGRKPVRWWPPVVADFIAKLLWKNMLLSCSYYDDMYKFHDHSNRIWTAFNLLLFLFLTHCESDIKSGFSAQIY